MTEERAPYHNEPIRRVGKERLRAADVLADSLDCGIALGGKFFDERAAILVRDMAAEVRRLRSLVKRSSDQWNAIPGSPPVCAGPFCPRVGGNCWWCGARIEGGGRIGSPTEPHGPTCPWPEIEAEVLAQREDVRG
jgi:hypothetical protein